MYHFRVLERPNAKAVTFCGSPYYMSPEIFSCKPYDAKVSLTNLLKYNDIPSIIIVYENIKYKIDHKDFYMFNI